MPDGQGLPAPPDVTVDPSTKERVLSGVGGMLKAGSGQDPNSSALVQAMQKHHQQQVDIAQKHYNDWKTYTGVLATGNNPETGKPLTAEEAEKYYNLREATGAALDKTAGVNKDIKGKFARVKMIADHIIKTHPKGGDDQGGGQGGGQQGGGQQGGMPQPPGWREHAQAQMDQAHVDTQKEFDSWKKQQDELHKNRMEEEEAKAKAAAQAKAANPSGRPVMGPAISARNARELAKQGRVYLDKDGQPIDLTNLPDNMGLKFIAWGGKNYYEPFSPNSKVITVGNETYAVSPMDAEAIGDKDHPAGTDLGQHNTGSTTRTTDPVTNQTTVAKHTPNTPGARSGGGLPAPPSTAAPRNSDAGKPTSAPLAPAHGDAGKPQSGSNLPALDEQGHIPNDYKGSTPQIIEGANQLLDGTDKDKLPTKTRELSSAMARKYGWEQGKFTPREQGALRNATQFIDDMLKDPGTFQVLDSTMTRMKLNQVLAGSEKQGPFGSAATTFAAGQMNDQEAKFIRQYNLIVQTISGIGPAIRGSGNKNTEAAIKRFLTDMPNPKTVQGSKDGMERLQLLKKEIHRALAKGTFTEGDMAKSNTKSKGLPKPPSASKSVDDEIMELVGAANKPK